MLLQKHSFDFHLSHLWLMLPLAPSPARAFTQGWVRLHRAAQWWCLWPCPSRRGTTEGPVSTRPAESIRAAHTTMTSAVVTTVGEAFEGLSPSLILSLFIFLLDLGLGFQLCTASIRFEIYFFCSFLFPSMIYNLARLRYHWYFLWIVQE
jgi:hypothetical protein